MECILRTPATIIGTLKSEKFYIEYDTIDKTVMIKDTTYQYINVHLEDLLKALEELDDPEAVEALSVWARGEDIC